MEKDIKTSTNHSSDCQINISANNEGREKLRGGRGGGGTCFSTYILILNSDVYLREKVFELFEARSKINTPTKEPPFTITPLPTMVKKIVSVRKVEKYFLVT